MSTTTEAAASPAVALFQKVHGKMVMLQRLDQQLGALIEQRRRVQAEIVGLQGQINEEIDRQLRTADELPARILSEIADSGRNGEMPSPSQMSYGGGGSRMADVDRSETSLSTNE